jgi:hypothetical protein
LIGNTLLAKPQDIQNLFYEYCSERLHEKSIVLLCAADNSALDYSQLSAGLRYQLRSLIAIEMISVYWSRLNIYGLKVATCMVIARFIWILVTLSMGR